MSVNPSVDAVEAQGKDTQRWSTASAPTFFSDEYNQNSLAAAYLAAGRTPQILPKPVSLPVSPGYNSEDSGITTVPDRSQGPCSEEFDFRMPSRDYIFGSAPAQAAAMAPAQQNFNSVPFQQSFNLGNTFIPMPVNGINGNMNLSGYQAWSPATRFPQPVFYPPFVHPSTSSARTFYPLPPPGCPCFPPLFQYPTLMPFPVANTPWEGFPVWNPIAESVEHTKQAAQTPASNASYRLSRRDRRAMYATLTAAVAAQNQEGDAIGAESAQLQQLKEDLKRNKSTGIADKPSASEFHIHNTPGKTYRLVKNDPLLLNTTVPKPPYCGFCRSNGETPEVFNSHSLKTRDGKLICPVLRKFVCPDCKATGDDAHTRRYCPMRAAEEGTTSTPYGHIFKYCHNSYGQLQLMKF